MVGRIKASPLARRIAQDHAIDLMTVRGSGPEGRIVKRDIEKALEGAPQVAVGQPASMLTAAQASKLQRADYESIRISQMRKTIAKRLSESKYSAPHFYLDC